MNRPLGEVEPIGAPEMLAYSCEVPVTVTLGRVRAPDRGGVRVDLTAREVSYANGLAASCSLDAADPDLPYALGLVLAREAGRVEHAVGVAASYPVGTQLTIVSDDRTCPPWLSLALARYGAVVAVHAVGMSPTVLLEEPPGGAGWPPEVGPVYRDAGLLTVAGPTGIWVSPCRPRRARRSRRARRWLRPLR